MAKLKVCAVEGCQALTFGIVCAEHRDLPADQLPPRLLVPPRPGPPPLAAPRS